MFHLSYSYPLIIMCIDIHHKALELLYWPAAFANHIMNALRKSSYVDRHRTKRSHERRAERFEHYVGLLLRFLQCLTCNKTADFRNQGELSEFARHFVSFGQVHVFVHKLLRIYVLIISLDVISNFLLPDLVVRWNC